MKSLKNNLILGLMLCISILGYVASCTHKDVTAPAAASNVIVITRGTAVLKPGSMTVGDSTQWKLDQVHSNVTWSTPYLGVAAPLTGRFNMFGIHNILASEMTNYTTTGQPLKDTSWAFDEANPANTYFNGYVQLNTSNTGQPGRDGGCYLSSVGAPAIVSGVQNLSNVNIARIQTTKVTLDPASSGYIVNFNLTWQGATTAPVTKALVGTLTYVAPGVVGAGTATPYKAFGLELKFQFNCRDFGVTSTSIADKIDIVVNANFNNK